MFPREGLLLDADNRFSSGLVRDEMGVLAPPADFDGLVSTAVVDSSPVESVNCSEDETFLLDPFVAAVSAEAMDVI